MRIFSLEENGMLEYNLLCYAKVLKTILLRAKSVKGLILINLLTLFAIA